MPLKTEGIDEPELNLTPMIDIVFLLIIFFLVGTEFAEDKSVEEKLTQIPIELPTTSSDRPLTNPPDPVTVSISRQGEIYLDANPAPLTLEDLKQRLAQEKDEFPNVSVIISGDGQSNLQVVVDVLRICEELEIKQTKLKARQIETPNE